MKRLLSKLLAGKRLAIAGFGREGQSTFKLLRNYFPHQQVTILDNNPATHDNILIKGEPGVEILTGQECFQLIDNYDVVIKSPGIPSRYLPSQLNKAFITSEADLFLQQFGNQVIGITGTKGKSTTSSLVAHMLSQAGFHAILAGNIGLPPFEIIGQIKEHTLVVMELSSHQLEFVTHSPHIGILLNIFQEHLDHYHSYLDYQLAKMNIAKFMSAEDFFIYNADNELLRLLVENNIPINASKFSISLNHGNSAIHLKGQDLIVEMAGKQQVLFDTGIDRPLKGTHNLYNIAAAASACHLAGMKSDDISNGIQTFRGLEHRIESVGEYAGIKWYNDSIATIPEAAIEAVKTLQEVDTLILGGFDRGIDYNPLYSFLRQSTIRNLIMTGDAGRRMLREYSAAGQMKQHAVEARDFTEVVSLAASITKKGFICLLSPAAASYDMFKNFEERGEVFKNKVRALGPHFKN